MTNKSSIWNLHIFKIRECSVFLNISLPLLIGTYFILDFAENQNLKLSSVGVLSFLLALILHDLIHYIVFKAGSFNLTSVKITPFGSIWSYKNPDYSNKRSPTRISFRIAEQLEYITHLLPCIICIVIATLINRDFSFNLSNPEDLSLAENLSYALLSLSFLNLLPIYPLDAFFSLQSIFRKYKKVQLTNLLAKLSFILSLFLLMLGMLIGYLPALILTLTISLFASKDSAKTKLESEINDLKIADVAIPKNHLICFDPLKTVESGLNIAVKSFQDIFPILNNNIVMAIITKDQLIKDYALNSNNYLKANAKKDFAFIDLASDINDAFRLMEENKSDYIIVNNNDEFYGIIVKDNLQECVLVNSFKKSVQQTEEDFF